MMLPAALCLGTMMPLVIRSVSPVELEHAGPLVGRAYMYNTIGAIVGSFVVGFVLLPELGVQGGLPVVVALYLCLAMFVAFFVAALRRLIAAILVASCALVFVPR